MNEQPDPKTKADRVAEVLAIMEEWGIEISELLTDEKDKIEPNHETIG